MALKTDTSSFKKRLDQKQTVTFAAARTATSRISLEGTYLYKDGSVEDGYAIRCHTSAQAIHRNSS